MKSSLLILLFAMSPIPPATSSKARRRRYRRPRPDNRGGPRAGLFGTVFDAKTGTIVASFPLGGIPQATVVDAQRGRVYVNLQDKNAIDVIDTATQQLKDTWSIEPRENQSGLAIDLVNQRLFVGCRNKLMVMVDATNGKVLAQVPNGPGVDASAYDPGTNLAFGSTGGDATVTIAHLDSPSTLTRVQTLATRPGARTVTVDLANRACEPCGKPSVRPNSQKLPLNA